MSLIHRQRSEKSHENKEVQQLYHDMLGSPLSETSERLLHTSYAERGIPREKLSRFLSAVDARDDEGTSRLCTNDCIWNTNTDRFGAACGKDSIKSLIRDKLPKMPKKCGEDQASSNDVNKWNRYDGSGFIKSLTRNPL